MADQRTMAQLLQAPTEGYKDAIVVPAITANNSKLKYSLLTLVQNKQFFGHDKEDPHAHITSTLKFPNVPNTSIKLMLFPFSLEGAAWIWLEKEPPRSIFTWDDLVLKFINQFFPPSKTTNLHNKSPISNNVLMNLSVKHQDSLNSAGGGNFLDQMPRECLGIIESKSKVRYSRNKPVVAKVSTNTSTFGISPDVAELKDMVKALLLHKKSQNQSPAPVKAVEESCEDFSAYVKANDAVMRNMQTQGQNMQNQLTNLTDLITKFVNSNSASTSSLGTLPRNTIANPRSDLKAITTRSGVSYDGAQIPPPPPSLPKVVEDEPKATKDTVSPTNNGNTEDVQPLAVQSKSPVLTSKPVTSPIFEPEIAPVSASKPYPKASIPYPSRRNNERNRKKANNQIEKFYQIFKNMSFEISFADALILMPKFASTLKALIGNKEKLSIAECLTLADLGASINLMPFSVWKRLSLPDLTPTFMTLELADRSISRPVRVAEDVYVKVGSFHFPADFVVVDFDADPRVPLILGRSFLKTGRALIDVFEDEPTSSEFYQPYLDPEGDIHLLEAFLNDDPSLPPPNQRNYMPEVRKELKIYEAKSEKSLVDEPLVVELKDLPPHLEYAFLEGDDKLLVIITKDLSVEEKTALITVLKSHKRAIAWKLSDIKGINPEFCTHKILMEEDFKPAVQHQRRVNPKIHDVIKQEVIKLLEAGLIYPIFDCPWVSPMHCVAKKGGFIVVENEDNELISTRLVKGWRVYIDYLKLNEATRKDHFPLPFMDQMPERSAGNQYYCFLDGFSGTFQRCMMAIFHDMIEKTMCDDTNLCLNWEKSHFMVKEDIVLGHKISKQGIEIDKAKVGVITKLPHPTTVKECVDAFQTLKRKLTEAPILIAPNWDMPFELMCDASDFDIGAVLGQRQDKHFRPIHYANKTMTEAESNYTTTEKEMLAVVYAFENFRSYLILNKSIVYTDHSALKYLFAKKDLKARLLRWVLLLQEFTFKVIDTKEAENLAVDHLP
uniref:Reverse transcriptase domain-containing protein n=1 Tax=Tanacetum cinerariifolium TaxID=118510 RepID=A0A6L2KJ19_TANCI|nr:reverse transcriptase domain-containing protein [Tanacetum cinerariifolium]